MESFKLSGISFMPEEWKPIKNLKKLTNYIDEAAQKGAQVIASPEGILDGYITHDLGKYKIKQVDEKSKGYKGRVAKFKKKAMDLAGKIVKDCIPVLQTKAAEHGVYLFINTLDLRGGKSVYNTTFVIGPDGKIIGKYDKVHAAFEIVNTLGKGYPVFKTVYAPIGVVVCADRQYPESCRSTRLNGAQVLIINSYGMYGEGANERFIRQRAYENGMYVLFCHPLETVLVDPKGSIIAGTSTWEHILVRDIDPKETMGRGLFGNQQMAKTYVTSAMSHDAHYKLKGKRARKEL